MGATLQAPEQHILPTKDLTLGIIGAPIKPFSREHLLNQNNDNIYDIYVCFADEILENFSNNDFKNNHL